MSNSITFNTVDLSTYKLTITSPGNNVLEQLVGQAQLQDKGYSFRPIRKPRSVRVRFSVTGTTRTNLDSNLDSIKNIITLLVPKALMFDSLPGRHFNAILEDFSGNYGGPTLFEGRMDFTCPDPLGYLITEDDHDHDISSSPITVDEPVGGTGYTNPVYTLTAKNTLTGATIKVNNLTTEEELIWVGDLAIDGTLVIDVARMLVSKGETASMGTVTGEFPRLKPGVTNQIKVTGLYVSATGNLNILYRDAYL